MLCQYFDKPNNNELESRTKSHVQPRVSSSTPDCISQSLMHRTGKTLITWDFLPVLGVQSRHRLKPWILKPCFSIAT